MDGFAVGRQSHSFVPPSEAYGGQAFNFGSFAGHFLYTSVMHKFTMRVLSIFFLTMSLTASGQDDGKEMYRFYSDVLPQIYKAGTSREKILILDSTYLTEIPLDEPAKLIRNYTYNT